MFRDTYKSANNDIVPDSEFLAQTLSCLEKSKKKSVIPFKTISSCAAALIIAAGSVFGYMRFTDAGKIDVAPKIVRLETDLESAALEDNAKSKQTGATSSTGAGVADANTNNYVKKSEKNTVDTQKNTLENSFASNNSTAETKTGKIEDTSAGEEISNEITADGVSNPTPASIPEVQTDDSAAYDGNSAQIARAVNENTTEDAIAFEHSEAEENIMTYSEYCNYLGEDVFAKAVVPSDMAPQLWSSVDLNKTPAPDFEFKGEGRYVRINAAVNLDNKAVNQSITFNEEGFSGTVESEKIKYDFAGYGLTQEEVNVLRDSLAD